MRLFRHFAPPALLAAGVLLPAFAFAGQIKVTVTTNEDTNNANCSLREAMQAHFNGAAYNGCGTGQGGTVSNGANSIVFTVDGTISVPQELANIKQGRALTLSGTGRTVTIACVNNRLFDIEPSGSFAVDNLTLSGCTTSGAGTAINSNNADLSLTQVTIKNFITNTGANGGAIVHSGGNLSMTNVTMQGNKIDDGNANTFLGSGGALALSNVALPKTVNIVNTTFDSNRADRNGGAIFIDNNPSLGHSITFTNVIFQSNQAFGNQTQDGGGAVWMQTGADANDLVLMTNVLFSTNSAVNGAGGGLLLANGSRLSYLNANLPSAGGIYASHFFNNTAGGPAGNDGSGGAIFSRGELTIVQSSFQSNKSTNGSGGAIAFGQSGATSTLANVTFNGNSAKQNGGAIARLTVSDAVKLINATIAGNAAAGTGGTSGGGAIYNTSASTGIVARNSLIGASAAVGGVANVGGNCQGAVQNSGNNLQWSPNAGCGVPAMAAGDPQLSGLTPALGPNVGVWVMPFAQAFNPALNAGDKATCEAGPMLRFDATGLPLVRPLNGPNCDIGAYESSLNSDRLFANGFEGQ